MPAHPRRSYGRDGEGLVKEPVGHEGDPRFAVEVRRERSIKVVDTGHAIDSAGAAINAVVRLYCGTERRRGPVEPGLVSAGRNAEDVGGLRVAEAEVVVDNEDGPLVRGQATEPAIDLVASVDSMVVACFDGPITRRRVSRRSGADGCARTPRNSP